MRNRIVNKVTKARAALILDAPFFGTMLFKLKCVIDNTCPTAYMDGLQIGYNEQFVEGLTIGQVKGLLCHEALHYMLKHHLRRDERDPKVWNMAADYVINQILDDAKYELPPGGLMNTAYKDMSSEKVYSMIPKQGSQGGGGKGKGKGKGGDWNWGEVRDQKTKDPGTGKEKAMTKAEKSAADGEVNINVGQAQMAAKSQGKLPAGLKRLIEGILEPKVNWREELQAFVQGFARDDYSYRRLNRAYLQRGFFVPTLYSESIGPIATAYDTSGSISDAQLKQAVHGELIEIHNNVKPSKIWAIFCDTKVYPDATQVFHNAEEIDLKPEGGGGTMFSPVFEYIEEEDMEPLCLIYFTDGYCNDFPQYEPEYPTLWVLTEKNDNFKPPFGHVIKT